MSGSGFTTLDLERRFRVSGDTVRGWIKAGALAAINTALKGKPRFVVTPDALAAFERSRSAVPPTKPKRRRKRDSNEIDFYPD